MLYKYCKDRLLFTKISNRKLFLLVLFQILILTSSFFIGSSTERRTIVKTLTPEEKLIIIREHPDSFSKDTLINLLKELNVKYPHIVLAQSIIETGHWTSRIFNENNNLFGMKEARSRIHTAKKTEHNHAYYETWRESVYDYSFYQCRYLSKLKSETEYFEYLGKNYAEAPNYVANLKRVIKNENLVNIFK